jgi:HTH-type transcriptional regulator / antitoxin HipB
VGGSIPESVGGFLRNQHLGALIRERRKELKLGQTELARRIGTSRQWIVAIEQGHPRAQLGLALSALDALGIGLTPGVIPPRKEGTPDLDAILASARKGRK